jgi:DNA-binding GntR family transcriptional regulator
VPERCDRASTKETCVMAGNGLPSDFGGELLSDKVKRLVLDRIIHGHYKPGERVVEFQLSKELGVSQSPVRDALRELAAIGVITMHARRGARVRMPSAKELADVSQVRAEIDALAARLAATSLTTATLTSLEELVERMLDKLSEGDFPAVTEADVRFHQLIVQASDNRALVQTFDQLAPFARTFLTLTLPDVDVREIVLEHKGILAALTAQDPDRAAEAARRHQLSVRALMLDHASHEEATDTDEATSAAQVS